MFSHCSCCYFHRLHHRHFVVIHTLFIMCNADVARDVKQFLLYPCQWQKAAASIIRRITIITLLIALLKGYFITIQILLYYCTCLHFDKNREGDDDYDALCSNIVVVMILTGTTYKFCITKFKVATDNALNMSNQPSMLLLLVVAVVVVGFT